MWKALILSSLLLVGCSTLPTPVAQAPQQEGNLRAAQDLYVAIQQTVIRRIRAVGAECQAGARPPAECAKIQEQVKTMAVLDYEISRKLSQAQPEFDYAKALDLLRMSEMLGAVAL